RRKRSSRKSRIRSLRTFLTNSRIAPSPSDNFSSPYILVSTVFSMHRIFLRKGQENSRNFHLDFMPSLNFIAFGAQDEIGQYQRCHSLDDRHRARHHTGVVAPLP